MSTYEIRGFETWIDFCGDFELYTEIPCTDTNFHVGQFYTAPIKYPFSHGPKVLQLDNYDSTNELNTTFSIVDIDSNEKKQSNFPIKQLNIRYDERLYFSVGKIRTFILLKVIENIWITNQVEHLALCIPIASFKEHHHDRRHIVSIQLFQMPQYFYLKPSEYGIYSESSARFDLTQYVHSNDIKPVTNRNKQFFRLSDDMIKLLYNHLCLYFFNEPLDTSLCDEINAFESIMMKEKETQDLFNK